MGFRLTYLNVRAAALAREPIPLFGVPFWVRTVEIKRQVVNSNKKCEIICDSESKHFINLSENQKLQSIVSHFSSGIPWEATPLYDLMLKRITEAGGTYKGLQSISDIHRYYNQMDEHFEKVKSDGLWVPVSTPFLSILDRKFPLNGITIQVLDKGEPCFAGRGTHRLGMSIAAGRELTPAYLIGVSKESLKDGTWSRYLNPAESKNI